MRQPCRAPSDRSFSRDRRSGLVDFLNAERATERATHMDPPECFALLSAPGTFPAFLRTAKTTTKCIASGLKRARGAFSRRDRRVSEAFAWIAFSIAAVGWLHASSSPATTKPTAFGTHSVSGRSSTAGLDEVLTELRSMRKEDRSKNGAIVALFEGIDRKLPHFTPPLTDRVERLPGVER
jgi:hypothetical protein